MWLITVCHELWPRELILTDVNSRKLAVDRRIRSWVTYSSIVYPIQADWPHSNCHTTHKILPKVARLSSVILKAICTGLVGSHLRARQTWMKYKIPTTIPLPVTGVLTELDAIQQLMQARRDLCNILSKEIGFLTATTHGYMAEIIRLSHTERQSLQELDHLLNSMNVSLL